MADEKVVSSISGLSKVTQKLVDDRQAEADAAESERKKAATDRKDRMAVLNATLNEAKANKLGRSSEAVAARNELKQIKKDGAEAKALLKKSEGANLEVSKSAAAALGISVDELALRQEAKIQLDDQKTGLDKLEEAIRVSGGDPAQNADFQQRTLAYQDATKAADAQGRTTEVTASEKLEAMKAQLEKNGQVATDSKEFNKLQYEIQDAELKERLRTATSASAKKEIKAERRSLAAKQEGLLGKIAGGINSLRDGAKEKLKSAGKGVMNLIKGFAVAGFALALVAFLNSEYWQKTKDYIINTLVPKIKGFYNAFFGEGGGFAKGIKALFGDKGGIGGIVLGIGSAVALFAAFKFVKLIKAVKGLLGGVSGFAKKLTGIGGKKGGAAGALGGGGAGGKGKGKGAAGVGKGIADIGKGLGKGIGGLLQGIFKGIAAGLAAFAPPHVALGAGVFAGAIIVIGAAIAGATYLLGKAMPTLAEGFKSFEALNGGALIQVGKGIGAVGLGLAVFGAGKAIEGVGGMLGSLGSFFGGKDKLTPLEQLKVFGDTKVNTVQATANANALVAYSKAMAAAGGAKAAEGLGGFVSGTLGSLGNFFGGEKQDPLSQLVKFGETTVNSKQVMKNADAMVAYSKAMLSGSAAGATTGLSSFATGVLGSLGAFFGGEKQDPLSQLVKFGNTAVNLANVDANAKAMGQYATAMAGAKKANPTAGEALGGFVSGVMGSLGNFFGADSPLEKLKKFGDMDINASGVVKNAKAMKEYTTAISGLGAAGKTDIDLFTDSVDDMRIAIEKLSGGTIQQGLRMFAKATRVFGGIDKGDIKKLNEEGLSIPVNVTGKAMVEMSQANAGGGGTPVVVNAPSTNVSSNSSSSSTFTNTSLSHPNAIVNSLNYSR